MGKFRNKLLAVVLLIVIADTVESMLSLRRGRSNSAPQSPAAAPHRSAAAPQPRISAVQFAKNTVGNFRQAIAK